jgi:hypothetical protein
MRFVDKTNGELAVPQEQVRRHQLPPMEETCQLCQEVKLKNETGNSCCRGGKVLLPQLRGPLQEFSHLLKDTLFSQGQVLQ